MSQHFAECFVDLSCIALTPQRTAELTLNHAEGRFDGFNAAAYRRRNVIERCVNKLKQWRGIATRYEKRAVSYRAMVIIATLMLWLTQ